MDRRDARDGGHLWNCDFHMVHEFRFSFGTAKLSTRSIVHLSREAAMSRVVVLLAILLLPSLLFAQADTSAILWEAGGRHGGAVNAGILTSDRQFLITGGEDSTIHVWNLARRELPRVIQLPDRAVLALLQIDDSLVVSACDDRLIRIWNRRSGEFVRSLGDPFVDTLDCMRLWIIGHGDTIVALGLRRSTPRELALIDGTSG